MGHTHNNVCVCKGKGVPMIIHENAGLRAYFTRLIQGAFCRFTSRTCWSRDLNPPARTHFRDRIPRKAPIIVSLSGANPSASAYRFAPRGGLQVRNLSASAEPRRSDRANRAIATGRGWWPIRRNGPQGNTWARSGSGAGVGRGLGAGGWGHVSP